MIALLLANWRTVAVLALLAALGLYGSFQHIGWQNCRAEFAQFRADTERLSAEAKVRSAQEAARFAKNAQEALDGLQTRYDDLSARYSRVRANAGRGGVPDLSSAAARLSACPGNDGKPDATARFLAEVEGRITGVLEQGDREIAKYRELWAVTEKNASGAPAP